MGFHIECEKRSQVRTKPDSCEMAFNVRLWVRKAMGQVEFYSADHRTDFEENANMRVFLLILLVVILLGGVYAYRNGIVSVAKSPTKTLIEVDTGRVKQDFRETVNNLDDMVAPRPNTVPTKQP